jgi:putative ATP-binding cassette transporter
LIVAPRYLHGTVEFGVVTQSAMAFAQLLGAFSLVIVQFQSISAFAAVVRRLGSLWREMNGGAYEAGPLSARDSIA